MRPFDEWVMQPITPPNQLPELPDGVDEIRPGQYVYRCRSCDSWFPMEWDIEEDCPDSHYCGGSPRCCP